MNQMLYPVEKGKRKWTNGPRGPLIVTLAAQITLVGAGCLHTGAALISQTEKFKRSLLLFGTGGHPRTSLTSSLNSETFW